ncbi:MAG: hypothetical protein ACJAWL_002817 [Motiliproteus sp.]
MKVLKYIKYVFLVIGMLLLAGGLYSYTDTRNLLSDAVLVEGVVVDLVQVRSTSSSNSGSISMSRDSRTYAPVVEFVTETGRTLKHYSSNSSQPASFFIGEKVGVYYDASAPGNAVINTFFALWGMAVIFAGIGATCFVVGFIMIASGIVKTRRVRFLKAKGMAINANIQSVEPNQALVVNGKSPFQICAQWQDPSTSALHIFKSENIWFNPTDYIESYAVTVLIEKGRPGNYYMDISFLPQLAG